MPPHLPKPDLAPPGPPVVDSQRLLGADGELRIRHQGEEYRLRRTRQGKLILTK